MKPDTGNCPNPSSSPDRKVGKMVAPKLGHSQRPPDFAEVERPLFVPSFAWPGIFSRRHRVQVARYAHSLNSRPPISVDYGETICGLCARLCWRNVAGQSYVLKSQGRQVMLPRYCRWLSPLQSQLGRGKGACCVLHIGLSLFLRYANPAQLYDDNRLFSHRFHLSDRRQL